MCKTLIVICLTFGVSANPQAVYAQDESPLQMETITQDGLKFRLPKDWPVEKRGGVVAPIPVEEYLTRKLNVIESRMQSIEKQMNSMDLRMRVMEEKARAQRGGLRSGEEQ